MKTSDFSSEEFDGGVILTPALTILYHPTFDRIGDRALVEQPASALSRDAPMFVAPRGGRALPLEHTSVSRTPLAITRLANGGLRIDLRETRTKLTYRGRPAEGGLDVSPSMLRRGAVLTIGGRVVLLVHRIGPPLPRAADDFGLVGESDGMQRVRADIQRVADLDVPVLVRGETGTGKELVARAVHLASGRSEGPFIAVNLGAIAPELAAAELFGAERGAYTGAVQAQTGYFTAARGGTLFLDEVGEAPLALQAMLLRVLQTGEIQRVGAQKSQKADVRILAATDADLEARIREGTFRAPLLHRLSSYEIAMPPLRERRDDIARLLAVFLGDELERIGEGHRFSGTAGDPPWLPTSLVARLVDLEWPGNVRQLQNVVRQLVIGSRGQDRIRQSPAIERLLAESTQRVVQRSTTSAHDGSRSRGPEPPRPKAVPEPPKPKAEPEPPRPKAEPEPERRKPGEMADEEVEAALRANRWDLVATAAALRVSRASLYVLIQKNPRLRTAGALSPDEIARCHEECDGDVERMVERLEVSEKALRRRLRELGLLASSAGSDRG
jgi:DNA-binding NtrC family response regulator